MKVTKLRGSDDTPEVCRLLYCGRRWQVLWCVTAGLRYWRVPAFGCGIQVGKLDIVRFPRFER